MSSTTSNENGEAQHSVSRTLRIISVSTLIPALAFNLAHGIAYHVSLPALGLIPYSFSVGLAIYVLGWWKRLCGKHRRIRLQDDPEGDKPTSLRSFLIALMDTVIGLSLTACIAVAYVKMAAWSWYYSADGNIVGTWATLPFIVNALIHGFFLLKYIWEVSKRRTTPSLPSACPHCPHCHGAPSDEPPLSKAPTAVAAV